MSRGDSSHADIAVVVSAPDLKPFAEGFVMDWEARRATRRSTCPTCGVIFAPGSSEAMPFCSPRCRSIDLGRWLNEEISLPVEPGDEEAWDLDDFDC